MANLSIFLFSIFGSIILIALIHVIYLRITTEFIKKKYIATKYKRNRYEAIIDDEKILQGTDLYRSIKNYQSYRNRKYDTMVRPYLKKNMYLNDFSYRILYINKLRYNEFLLKYIEKDFSEVSYFKAINRDKIINDLTK